MTEEEVSRVGESLGPVIRKYRRSKPRAGKGAGKTDMRPDHITTAV
jgi:hypothetical protein